MGRTTRRNRGKGRRKTCKKKGNPWGYHLTINAGNCDPAAIRSKETIAKFTKDLVKTIDMVAFGKPQIVMFGEGLQKGYTLIQLIETSNISAHFAEETNDVYFDVFSCKPFNPKLVFPLFRSYFKPKKINSKFFTRQA
jgi:S-adenosylmethionine/arginine decarboxylase-like enzyme